MSQHKFAIGQIVDFDTRLAPMPRPTGPYEVTRVLPAEDARTQAYRIKSKAEPFERSAKEYEIVAVQPVVSKLTKTFGAEAGADRAH
jgi:hypothetical protein